MEIEKHNLYPTMFILGHRMIDATPKKCGAIIVKGTFQDIDQPRVAETQSPIFLTDVPFNFVRNSSFEAEDMAPWQTTEGAPTRLDGGIDDRRDNGKMVELKSNDKPDRLTQKVKFDQPIGGRTFIFSFYARANANVTINGFTLKATSTGHSICSITASLTQTFQRFPSAPETWPATLNNEKTDKEIELILPGSGNSQNPIYFDRVQVEEVKSVTRWDEDTVFRYEHDLVPFKPHADVIILGAAEPLDGDRAKPWTLILKNETGLVIEKSFDAVAPENVHFHFPTKTMFGWAPRGQGERKEQVGIDLENFDPETKLPIKFNDLFYNGYDRALSGSVPLPYLNDGTRFKFTSKRETPLAERMLFEVQLPATRPTAILREQEKNGQQTERKIALNLDTVIIEPELDRYMVIWRGSWPFDDKNKERYLKLSVTGGV
ncbi:DUF2169 domain-containing protein [bacterium]|nr:DUF2169 domain-containing protein [bacterium]